MHLGACLSLLPFAAVDLLHLSWVLTVAQTVSGSPDRPRPPPIWSPGSQLVAPSLRMPPTHRLHRLPARPALAQHLSLHPKFLLQILSLTRRLMRARSASDGSPSFHQQCALTLTFHRSKHDLNEVARHYARTVSMFTRISDILAVGLYYEEHTDLEPDAL